MVPDEYSSLLVSFSTLLPSMSELPALGNQLITCYEDLTRSVGENLQFDRFYFLGSGPRYGLACEANLKLKEMSLTVSEPFHFFEFRHGPMSMVSKETVAIGLLSDENQKHEQTVLDEMAHLGGHIISLGERDADVGFGSKLPEAVRNVLYLPVLHLMAYYRSIAKELNPDSPTNLTSVIKLDLS